MAATIRLSQQHSCSLDHLVGDRKQSVRKSKAKHPCGLCVDNQLELVCLHDRQVLRRRALENAAGINANVTKPTHNIRSVAHQSTGFGVVTRRIYREQPVEAGLMRQLDTPAVQERGGAHKDAIGPLATHGFERGIDLSTGVGIEDLDLQPHGASGLVHGLQLRFSICVSRIDEHCDAREVGHQLGERI